MICASVFIQVVVRGLYAKRLSLLDNIKSSKKEGKGRSYLVLALVAWVRVLLRRGWGRRLPFDVPLRRDWD